MTRPQLNRLNIRGARQSGWIGHCATWVPARGLGVALAVWLVVACQSGLAQLPTAPSQTLAFNGVGHVSLDLINLILERKILEQQTVRDEVAGAMTVADTTTTGRLRAEFIPSRNMGIVEFRMIGAMAAPNATATKGSVRVQMASHTSIDARKRVLITPDGLFPGASQADCDTQTEILDVEANRRVVERLARRRVEKMRPEAQQKTSQQVAQRVEEELDKQANDPLSGANKFYADNLRLPLTKAGGFPRDLRVSTTSSHIQIWLLSQQPGQMAPPARIPRLNAGYDIHVCGHESLVANMAEPLVQGKTFNDKQFLEVMKIMTGTAPRGLWVFDGRDRWNVTFAEKLPIQAQFANGTFRLTYQFQASTCGDDTVEAPILASALYRPEMTSDGVHLIRESTPIVAYTDSAPDTDARLRVLMQLNKRFTAFFQPEIYFDGLAPPAGGTWAKLKELKLVELNCHEGWFTIGYELNQPSKVAAQPKP